ncbi:MAG: hypothetical protein QOD10_2576 [Mycobacterium sp.]|jgi:hypothetical protein|nr:hypothetical protein [Mycobacterium sp.]
MPGTGAAGVAAPESGSGNLYTPLKCDALTGARAGPNNGLTAGP